MIQITLAFLAGAIVVFVYLHKHTSAAVNLSTTLSNDLNAAKAELAKLQAAAQKP